MEDEALVAAIRQVEIRLLQVRALREIERVIARGFAIDEAPDTVLDHVHDILITLLVDIATIRERAAAPRGRADRPRRFRRQRIAAALPTAVVRPHSITHWPVAGARNDARSRPPQRGRRPRRPRRTR